MKKLVKMPVNTLYTILIGLMLILVAQSLHSMMLVKDVQVFNTWMAEQSVSTLKEFNEDQLFGVFVTAHMSAYLSFVIAPIIFAIHSYLSYSKLRVTKLFVFWWVVLMGANLALLLVTSQQLSVFSIIGIVGYLIVIFALLRLNGHITREQQT